jgi:amino acid transporter
LGDPKTPGLQRHFGLLHATALNITMIVGAGVFVTVAPMIKELPGPYALLGWLLAGVVMLFDGLIWSELGATLPGSGGSYLYLLECYGRSRWGRLMAFLFIWQFLISGPLEIGSGLIAMAQFTSAITPGFTEFDKAKTWELILWRSRDPAISLAIAPSRLVALALGLFILVLLYRRITVLGRLTVTLWLGVLGVIAWILFAGFLHFDPGRAFSLEGVPAGLPPDFARHVGAAMRLAMYSYLGYYTICYIGDEVRDPGRVIPRSIVLSALLVCVLFAAVHLAFVGTVPWQEAKDLSSLPADFMRRIYGQGWAVQLITVLLIWSCFGSAFAGVLGYSRIPYGAARYGHFFSALGRVHPVHAIPHVSLLLIGALSLFWSLFSLQTVIDALITTRIIEQFIGQIFGVILLRRRQPDRPRPYRIWLYPLPCAIALAGWLFMYVTAQSLFMLLGLGTLLAGSGAFLIWSRWTGGWPFCSGNKSDGTEGAT